MPLKVSIRGRGAGGRGPLMAVGVGCQSTAKVSGDAIQDADGRGLGSEAVALLPDSVSVIDRPTG